MLKIKTKTYLLYDQTGCKFICLQIFYRLKPYECIGCSIIRSHSVCTFKFSSGNVIEFLRLMVGVSTLRYREFFQQFVHNSYIDYYVERTRCVLSKFSEEISSIIDQARTTFLFTDYIIIFTFIHLYLPIWCNIRLQLGLYFHLLQKLPADLPTYLHF